MAAYIVFLVEEITDEQALARYRQNVRATMAGWNITPRVLYGRHSVVEGKPLQGIAMVEFPTYEEAERWYRSPAYQAVLKHRLEGANCHTVIMEGA